MMKPVQHLNLDDVLFIHSLAIEDQGGDHGIRDHGLLESAMAQPKQSFGGSPVHTTLEEVAAAYLFYICRNHPFIDGNKRAGYGAMIGFLAVNGVGVRARRDEAVEMVLAIASGVSGREAIVEWVKPRMHPLDGRS
ncbi:MAG: type II toxin-antitoxin system death-on-curing family toxin [Phycisphaeraceae bacterium]|nr:type II toxin-antitoxin system death-on-curing family toxin [Phycisphaeraceae bacterium]